MKERNRERLFVLLVMLLVAGLVLAMQQGCGMIAGIGRDVTAMAEGGATKAADDAAKINGKGK